MPNSTGDGVYGTTTKNYTMFWQAQVHAYVPSVVADGVVGTNSWNAARFLFVHNSWVSGSYEGWVWDDPEMPPSMSMPFMLRYVPYDLWQITPITCQESTYAHNVTHPDLPITALSPSCTD